MYCVPEMVGYTFHLRSLFGYVPNASKTYLVVKDKYAAAAAAARRTFSGTGIVIATDGQRLHLVIRIIL